MQGDPEDLAERALRITRDRSYTELDIARDIVSNGAPVFARIGTFRFGADGAPPVATDWVGIAVVTRGHGIHLGARGSFPVGPGTVLAARPGTWSQVVDCDLDSAAIGISPALFATDLAFLRPRPGVRDLLFPSARAVRGVLVLEIDPGAALDFAVEVERLARLLDEQPHDHVMVLGQMIFAVGVLARALPDSARDRVTHPGVEAVLNRLEAEPERAWRLDDLARIANLDAAYLVRIFRAEVGVPPMAHLARVRVERATVLLAERRLSIAQIGEAVGWPDSAHFSRRFRSLMGVPPTQYREALHRSLAGDGSPSGSGP